MTARYEDALQQALEAARAGADVEAVIERFPEHAAGLREDLRTTGALTRTAQTAPPPRPEARVRASQMLQAQLQTEPRTQEPRRLRRFGSLPSPRFAMAAVVVALVVMGAGFLLGGDGSTVQAATIEGVVVENTGGRLTVQTLDALERVTVPPGALVSDVAGVPLGLAAIEPGQIVVIQGERRDRDILAGQVQRYMDSIEAWCAEDTERCLRISDRLAQAIDECERSRQACAVVRERFELLRQRTVESLRFESLRLACREGNERACREFVILCRDRLDACGELDHPFVAPTPDRGRSDAPAVTRTPPTARTPSPAPSDSIDRRPTSTATPVPPRPVATAVPRDVPLTPTPESRELSPTATPGRDTVAPPRLEPTVTRAADRDVAEVTPVSTPSDAATAEPQPTEAPGQTPRDGDAPSDGRQAD